MEHKHNKDYWVKRKYWGPIGLLIVILIIARFVDRRYEIKRNRLTTVGKVERIYRSGKTGSSIVYNYNVNGQIYQNTDGLGSGGGNKEDLLGKEFPVVYSAKNPDKSDLLITSEDFEFYDLPIPDSLVIYTKRFPE